MADFRHNLEQTEKFFEPENLASLMLQYEGVALLVVDVQRAYCDPRFRTKRGNAQTVAVSKRIQSMVPAFREAGVPVYAVYYTRESLEGNPGLNFYKFKPRAKDTLIAKSTNSAFESSDIKNILRADGKNLLLTCGFNLNACIKATVMDAREEGFQVCLLRDLTGNDNYSPVQNAAKHLTDMKNAGVVIASSKAALKYLPSPGA